MDAIIDPKEIIETAKTHMFKIFTFTFLAFILYSSWNMCGTEYHGLYVYGSCQELQDKKMDQAMLENLGINPIASPDGMIEYIKPQHNPLNTIRDTIQLDDDYTIIATTTSTTTTSTTIPCKECEDCICTCPTCTVTACPTNNYEELNTEVKTWRPTGAPSVQHGWFQMRDRLLEYTGGKRSKYKEGPSINYRPITTKPETTFNIMKTNGTECFTLEQYPDLNDRKRWNWNCNDGSNITICHL